MSGWPPRILWENHLWPGGLPGDTDPKQVMELLSPVLEHCTAHSWSLYSGDHPDTHAEFSQGLFWNFHAIQSQPSPPPGSPLWLPPADLFPFWEVQIPFNYIYFPPSPSPCSCPSPSPSSSPSSSFFFFFVLFLRPGFTMDGLELIT